MTTTSLEVELDSEIETYRQLCPPPSSACKDHILGPVKADVLTNPQVAVPRNVRWPTFYETGKQVKSLEVP